MWLSGEDDRLSDPSYRHSRRKTDSATDHTLSAWLCDQHHSQPGAIYLSECTELGTIYTPDELKAITSLAHQYGMRVHMDGARIANAAVALGCDVRSFTKDLGVDMMSFGGTKNGMMMAEFRRRF